jgi:hypothetical protein
MKIASLLASVSWMENEGGYSSAHLQDASCSKRGNPMKTASTSTLVPQADFEQPDTAFSEDSSSVFSESSAVDAETRNLMIAEAAYYRAEKRDFATGYEWEDWLAAEAEIG